MVQQAKQISTLPSYKMLNATSQSVFLKSCHAIPRLNMLFPGKYRRIQDRREMYVERSKLMGIGSLPLKTPGDAVKERKLKGLRLSVQMPSLADFR